MKRPRSTLQLNLDRARRERGWSMRDLSLRAGLNEGAVKAIMQGRSESPRENTIRKLAGALGCRVVDLIGESANTNAPGAATESAPSVSGGYGQRIAATRLDREESQEEFARALGVPVDMVRLWEADALAPDLAALGKLRQVGISADWVLFGDREGMRGDAPGAPPKAAETVRAQRQRR